MRYTVKRTQANNMEHNGEKHLKSTLHEHTYTWTHTHERAYTLECITHIHAKKRRKRGGNKNLSDF